MGLGPLKGYCSRYQRALIQISQNLPC